MAFNGSGVFQRLYNWTNDAAANIKIRADRMDAEMDGMATGLSTCLTKDGQTTVTANLPMATFKHTNVGDATARTQYATYGQLMDGKGKYPASVGGTADAITLTFSPSFTAYVAGMRLTFIASGANTGAVTVNVDGIGAKSVTKRGTTALAASDIPGSGAICDIEYDGTRFQLLNVFPGAATSSGTGVVELATTAETRTGTDSTRAVTPAGLAFALVPLGGIIPYGGTSAPTNFLLCYGQAISRTTYADLYAVVGDTYGAGDGSTTFNLPDIRGRVIAGQDDMGGSSANRLTNQSGGLNGDDLGATGGSETHTLTESQIPAHSHFNGIAGTSTDVGRVFVYGGTTSGAPGSATGNVNGSTTTSTHQGITSSTGSGSAHNNVQPTIILNYIIYAGA